MPLAKAMMEAAGNSTQPVYIEDVFSTYLYTGNGSTQTITNGIDLAGKGGLVWTKSRATRGHYLVDTVRGGDNILQSQTNYSQTNTSPDSFVFANNGYTPFSSGYVNAVNASGENFASWTFRKAPKFFDVVTYTGNGSNPRNIDHALGSTPGCIIVKETNASSNWAVWHRSLGDGARAFLNLTNASSTVSGVNWFGTSNSTITSTAFSVGSNLNTSGGTYVAYLFAHNAGGFGLTGTDNMISCGSYTGNGSATGPTVTLGYEPQFVMFKRTDTTSNWTMVDTMRGLPIGADATLLYANLSNAEGTNTIANLTATGFQLNTTFPAVNASGGTYIYIAIRRGPMKVPTDGTKVFAPVATSGSTGTTHNIGFPLDLQMSNYRTGSFTYVSDRLRGVDSTTNETAYPFLKTESTSAEVTSVAFTRNVNNTSFQTPAFLTGLTQIYWNFRRAPGFFDEVCYRGTGSATTVAHNLGVAPELMIVKARQTVAGYNQDWLVYQKDRGYLKYLVLNISDAEQTGYSTNPWTATPSASSFSVGSWEAVNFSGYNYVAYLFASCPGVSKVGSYTGTGTTQQINCGFTAGARFVLIKRTDSTGDWYVWDSARGIVSGNDPYLLLNSTAAEVTSTDYIDTYSAGFEISSTAPAAINASGGTFIYLAIA